MDKSCQSGTSKIYKYVYTYRQAVTVSGCVPNGGCHDTAIFFTRDKSAEMRGEGNIRRVAVSTPSTLLYAPGTTILLTQSRPTKTQKTKMTIQNTKHSPLGVCGFRGFFGQAVVVRSRLERSRHIVPCIARRITKQNTVQHT